MDTNAGTNMTDFGPAQSDNDSPVAAAVDDSTIDRNSLILFAFHLSALFGLNPSTGPRSSADAQSSGGQLNPGHNEYQEDVQGRADEGRGTNCASHGLCGRRDCYDHRGHERHYDHHGQDEHFQQPDRHGQHEQLEYCGPEGSDGVGADLVLHVRPVNDNHGAHEAYEVYAVQAMYDAYGPHMIGAQHVNYDSIAIGITYSNNGVLGDDWGSDLSASPPGNHNSPNTDIMEDSDDIQPTNPGTFDYWMVANDRDSIGTAEYLYGNCQAGYGEGYFHGGQ